MSDTNEKTGVFGKLKKALGGSDCCCCGVRIVPEKQDEEDGKSE